MTPARRLRPTDPLPPPWRAAVARVLRLALPLAALGILSTVFLVSRNIDPGRAVELADIDIAELARSPRIGTARFAAVTSDATALVVEAETVRSVNDLDQSGPVHLTLSAPEGVLEFPTGRDVTFTAQIGELEQARDLLTLRDEITLYSSDGFVLSMAELVSSLSETRLDGTGGVTGHGPPGDLQADQLALRPSPAGPEGYLLAFTGNVRLIYQPPE